MNDPSRPVINRAGWRRQGVDENMLYLFACETWKSDVCVGLDPIEVAKTLLRNGYLEKGDGKNIPKKEVIPGMGQIRVYVVKHTIMDGH
jgi:putative DNA primase/helicase